MCVSMAFCVFTDWSKGFNEEAVINPIFSQILPFRAEFDHHILIVLYFVLRFFLKKYLYSLTSTNSQYIFIINEVSIFDNTK